MTKRFQNYRYLSAIVAATSGESVYDESRINDNASVSNASKVSQSLKDVLPPFPKTYAKSFIGVKLTEDELNDRYICDMIALCSDIFLRCYILDIHVMYHFNMVYMHA